ncbi:MAG: hypothetical protein QXF08_05220, partial [Nitrososphaerota archaeon]
WVGTSSIPWDTPGRVSFRGRPFWIRQGAYPRRSASKNADSQRCSYPSIDAEISQSKCYANNGHALDTMLLVFS